MISTRYFTAFLFIATALFITSCNSTNTDKSASSSPQTINDEAPIISERIDGPANIRDSVNGRLLFVLNDDVAISANTSKNSWLKVGIVADLNKEQWETKIIAKGSSIIVDGKEVGKAMED